MDDLMEQREPTLAEQIDAHQRQHLMKYPPGTWNEKTQQTNQNFNWDGKGDLIVECDRFEEFACMQVVHDLPERIIPQAELRRWAKLGYTQRPTLCKTCKQLKNWIKSGGDPNMLIFDKDSGELAQKEIDHEEEDHEEDREVEHIIEAKKKATELETSGGEEEEEEEKKAQWVEHKRQSKKEKQKQRKAAEAADALLSGFGKGNGKGKKSRT
jgi:hypothetical protein